MEQRLAAACSGISDLSVPLRDLWNPWRCPAQFLPYLAWAFSVDRWEESWTVDSKRQAVSDAFFVHQRKGTVAAVRRVIEALGYSMTLDEWWTAGDVPGTFRLVIDLHDVGINEPMIAELERIIGDAKPVSRHITQISYSATVSGVAYIGAAITEGDGIAVYPEQYEPAGSVYYDGASEYDSTIYFTGK